MNWKNNKISEVAKEQIWKEHVRNESQYRNSKETFSMNPFKLEKSKPVSEPITKRPKRFLNKEKVLLQSLKEKLSHSQDERAQRLLEQINADIEDEAFTDETKPDEVERKKKAVQEIHESLLAVHKTPVEKYPIPMTASQEVGWLSRPLVQPDPRFKHSLKPCEITRFADNLVASSTTR